MSNIRNPGALNKKIVFEQSERQIQMLELMFLLFATTRLGWIRWGQCDFAYVHENIRLGAAAERRGAKNEPTSDHNENANVYH